jgi:hypothetical protein
MQWKPSRKKEKGGENPTGLSPRKARRRLQDGGLGGTAQGEAIQIRMEFFTAMHKIADICKDISKHKKIIYQKLTDIVEMFAVPDESEEKYRMKRIGREGRKSGLVQNTKWKSGICETRCQHTGNCMQCGKFRTIDCTPFKDEQ